MKKYMVIVLVILTLTGLIVLTGCQGHYNISVYDGLDNYADDAKFNDLDGKNISRFKMNNSTGKNNFVTVDLGSVKDFNTIVMKESSYGIKRFHIYGGNENGRDYKLIHVGDSVEGMRVCYVGEQSYRYLRIMVVDHDGSYQLDDIGIYNKKTSADTKLRVTGYLVMSDITEKSDLSMLNGVTDIILFGTANFTAEGGLEYMVWDGAKDVNIGYDGYKDKVDIVRSAIGDRDVNLIADIHLNYASTMSGAMDIMSTYKDKTIQSVMSLVNNCGLDGYAIDYEYPSKAKEWKYYNEFIVAVKAALGDKLLCVATAGWANKFTDEAIKSIDRVEMMGYDLIDDNGYHAAFYFTAIDQIELLVKRGFSREQIDLGMPFYSRPLNGYGYWGPYNSVADKLGKYEFIDDSPAYDHEGMPLASPRYFNSGAMVADKTAYALDSGLGGLMIWHMACDTSYDNELSLTKIINDTITSKKAV